MSTESAKRETYVLSANAEFKSQYNKTLRWSVAIALLITVVAFIVSPEIRFTPYKLRTEELEVVDIEDQPEDIDRFPHLRWKSLDKPRNGHVVPFGDANRNAEAEQILQKSQHSSKETPVRP